MLGAQPCGQDEHEHGRGAEPCCEAGDSKGGRQGEEGVRPVGVWELVGLTRFLTAPTGLTINMCDGVEYWEFSTVITYTIVGE